MIQLQIFAGSTTSHLPLFGPLCLCIQAPKLWSFTQLTSSSFGHLFKNRIALYLAAIKEADMLLPF